MTLLHYKPTRASAVLLVIRVFFFFFAVQGQFLENSGKRICGILKIIIKNFKKFINWVILLSRSKKENALEANSSAWEAGLEGHLLSKEGRRVPQRRGWCLTRIPPAQPVAFKCLGFPSSLVAGALLSSLPSDEGIPSRGVGGKYHGWVKEGTAPCWGEEAAFWSLHPWSGDTGSPSRLRAQKHEI